MKFEDLSVGQQFEFAEKTAVGCGMYNGLATKKSSNTYTMNNTWWITRTIGDASVLVVNK